MLHNLKQKFNIFVETKVFEIFVIVVVVVERCALFIHKNEYLWLVYDLIYKEKDSKIE